MSFKKLYGCINFSIVVLILLAMSVFSCTSENEIEDITTASKIVDEEIVAEQTINEIETCLLYTSDAADE